MAMTMKNLLNVLIGSVIVGERLNTVVITEASTKNKIKNGKIFFIFTFVSSAEFFSFLVR